MGLLADAHGSGVYGLKIATPNSVEETTRRWLDEFGATPRGSELEDIALAERVAYVGASSDVYDRIMDHARSDVRQSSYLRVFPVADVIDVRPDPDPFEAERSVAYAFASNGWTVLTDGEVLTP
jgi:hypothetical protein